MTHIYYGCDEFPTPRDRYFEEYNLLELDLAEFDAPPKTSTLNGWRVDSPRGFAFVLHVNEGFRDELVRLRREESTELTEVLIDEWESTLEHARALAAKAVLLRTPEEFAPGPVSRTLVERFAQQLAAEANPAVIWQTHGLWQTGDTRDFAESNGLIYEFDPFLAHREQLGWTHGDACFVLTERAALRRKYDQHDMERLVHWSEAYDRVFVLLRGRFKWDHGRELRHALEYA